MKHDKRRSLSKLPAPVALACLMLLGATVAHPQEPVGGSAAMPFIIQGQSVQSVGELVELAGGVVTHELGIIRGVGAQLTDTQVIALQQMEGITRVSPDAAVKLASTTCTVVGSSELVFDGRKVRWYLTNVGSETVLIDTVSATWPNDLRKLKKIKVRGSDIFTEAQVPPSVTITSGWRSRTAAGL